MILVSARSNFELIVSLSLFVVGGLVQVPQFGSSVSSVDSFTDNTSVYQMILKICLNVRFGVIKNF